MAKPQFTYRKAYNSWAFAQNDLIDHDKFAKMAKDRGIGFVYGRAQALLEECDRAGALRPVAYRAGGYYTGSLVFREETEFVPWDDYRIPEDGMLQMRALYTPWQLLYAKDAHDLRTSTASVEWFLKSKGRKLGAGARPMLEARDDRWRDLDDYWRIVMLMLVRLQNRYLPSVRGTLTTSSWTVPFDATGEQFDTDAAVREFDAKKVLRELGLTVKEVENVHHRLVTAHAFDDPLEDWHMLVRMTPYKHRQKLKGDALRAQDTFDAAQMLRHFYFHLTDGKLLPQADEVFDLSGGGWREEVYGHGPRLMYTRQDLKNELQRLGLYPHVVHLVVEGTTEAVLLEKLIASLGFDAEERGVTFSTFDGVDQHKLRRAILDFAQSHTKYPVLISDREGGIEAEVRALQEEGLLHEGSTYLWKKSLEEDNFTHEELVELARRVAVKQGAMLKLAASTLRRKHRERRQRSKDTVGLAEVLIQLARAPRHGSIRIDKPDLGEEMAAFLRDEINAPGADIEELGEKRRVIGVLLHILRAS